MVYGWIAEFRPALLGQRPLTDAHIARLVQLDERIDERDIELVRSLTKQDPVYLTTRELRMVITDDIGEEQIQEIVVLRAEVFGRMASLVPDLLGYLDVRENSDLAYAIRMLSSLCGDFSLRTPQPRRDKVRNDEKKRVAAVRTLADELITALTTNETDIAAEFDVAWEATTALEAGQINLPARGTREPLYESLIRQIKLVVGIAELKEMDLANNLPSLRLSGPMSKADVVQCVYDLHRVCKGPPLVTTPGSNFSYLCSLVYEMATGIADESLAGAINRFSRSYERREQDEYDLEVAADLNAIETDDNFYGVRSHAKNLRERASHIQRTIASTTLSKSALSALEPQVQVLLSRAALADAEFGPHIVWSDQEPSTKREAWRREYTEMEEKRRDIEIMLGTMRRMLRARGIDPNLAESTELQSTSASENERQSDVD